MAEGFEGGSRVEWVNGSVEDLEGLGLGGGKSKAQCTGCGFHGGEGK